MNVIRISATAGADRTIRVAIPVDAAGDYDLVITAAPSGGASRKKSGTLDDLTWDVTEKNAGDAIDDTFFGDMNPARKPDPLGGLS
jgi:hypothetical protein